METHTPNYYAVIPASVRYDNTLSASEKLLYAEISALSNKNGFCHAKNTYFADLFNVDKRTVQRWFEKLTARGYITSEIERDDKNTVVKRVIKLIDKTSVKVDTNVTTPHDKNVMTPHDKNVQTPHDKNVTYNNTRNNNIININNIPPDPQRGGGHLEPDICTLWNRIANRWNLAKIKSMSDVRRKKLKLRLEESGCESYAELFEKIDEAIMGSCFLQGKKMERVGGEWTKVDANWVCDFDFFLQQSRLQKALDGGYDDPDVRRHKSEGRWESMKAWINRTKENNALQTE